MNKKNLTILVLGLLVGIFFGDFLDPLNMSKKSEEPYFMLEEDVIIDGVGNLKTGVKIKYDEGFSEGFTRFILYLNAKDVSLKRLNVSKENHIIPYWLEKENNSSQNNN